MEFQYKMSIALKCTWQTHIDMYIYFCIKGIHFLCIKFAHNFIYIHFLFYSSLVVCISNNKYYKFIFAFQMERILNEY